MIDADGDGNLDLFFVNGAALKIGMNTKDRADKSDSRYWNRLYRNEGDGTFADITEKAGLRGNGYGQGVAVSDCDNDGRADLFLTALGGNALYRNQGAAVFEDVTAKAGLAGGGWSTSAGFIDYDRDGNLDLFIARYLDWDFGNNKRCGGEGLALQAYCGIGAPARILLASGGEQFGFVSTAGSYLSAHDKRVHFGLGRDRQVKLLEIRWPSGVAQTWKNVAANQIFVAKEAAQ
jgi:ASPIC and UnbV/FG-GAP-like repeat